MSTNSGKRAGLLIGGFFVIILLVMGVYWFRPRHPTKPAQPSLVVVGVGLYVGRNKETRKFQVTRTFPNSPADKAGFTPGLIVNKVNHVLAEEKNIKELSALLMGPVGTKVLVETIDASGATNEVELTRDQFVNHSTR